MTDLTQNEIISRVSSIFDVKEIIININDIQFEIEDKNFKDKFVNLARQLEVRNFAPRLEKSSGQMYIFVTKLPEAKRKWLSNSWLPRILFAVISAAAPWANGKNEPSPKCSDGSRRSSRWWGA